MFLSQAFGDNRLPPKKGLGVPKERGLSPGSRLAICVKNVSTETFKLPLEVCVLFRVSDLRRHRLGVIGSGWLGVSLLCWFVCFKGKVKGIGQLQGQGHRSRSSELTPTVRTALTAVVAVLTLVWVCGLCPHYFVQVALASLS